MLCQIRWLTFYGRRKYFGNYSSSFVFGIYMKILLGSHFFLPSVGGIETCSLTLAREFRNEGHEVRIVTQSISDNSRNDHGFCVLRQPKWNELRLAIQWCDVFYQNNISLQTAWPLVLIRKPWFVTTATWLGMNEKAIGTTGQLKRCMLRFAFYRKV
jgi:hypothetical protein